MELSQQTIEIAIHAVTKEHMRISTGASNTQPDSFVFKMADRNYREALHELRHFLDTAQ